MTQRIAYSLWGRRRAGSPARWHGRWVASALAKLVAFALLLGLSSTALAQRAMILTGTRYSENSWWQFVKQRILDTGLYPDGVDTMDCGYRDPTLSNLAAYRLVVLVSSDYGYSTSDGMGNALAEYMASVPGAAVLAFYPFTWQTGVASAPNVGGRFLTTYALTTQTATAETKATKRGMYIASDFLMQGVGDFECGGNCMRVTGGMPKPGATVVAYWADGTILAARGKRRVDLNMWSADEGIIAGSWQPQAERLITNAVIYLSSLLTAEPRNVEFDQSPLGAETDGEVIKFRNVYSQPVKLTGLGVDGAGRAHFSVSATKVPTAAAPITLAPGAIYEVSAKFKPQIQGTHKAIAFVSLDGFERIEVPLSGASRGNLYVSLSPINFGGVPLGVSSAPMTVKLKNLGAVPINLEKPTLGDTTNYELTPLVPDATVTMLPGATYSFDLKMKPAAMAGEFPSEVIVKSNDTGSPLEIKIIGMSGPPKLKVPYTSLWLSDTPVGSKALPLEVMMYNEGLSDLDVKSITTDVTEFEILNGPTMGSPVKIKAKQAALFQLVFAPTSGMLRSGKLTIVSSEPDGMGGDSSKVISLSGNGTEPKFVVSSSALDFGTTDIGKPVAGQAVELKNTGDGDLMVKELSVMPGMGGDSFVVSSLSPVPFVVRAGSSVPVTVDFAPKAAGMVSGTLRVVTDLAMGGSAMVALKGVANGAVAKIDPPMLSFGDQKVKTMAVKAVTLRNDGNKDLTIVRSRLVPAIGVYAAMLPADGTKVPAGMSVSINVTVMPAMAGPANARLEIETDDPGVPAGTQFTSALTVNGVVPGATISQTDLAFDPILVGLRSDMKTVKVTNSGNIVIDNLTAAISASTMGNDAGDFGYVPGFKNKLKPGESTDIGVYFEPRVGKMLHNATLVLQADGVQVAMTVALRGSSMSASLTAQPSLLKFENTPVGGMSQTKWVTLTNEGAPEIQIEISVPASEDFTIDLGSVKDKLAMGESTRIPVIFSPKAKGQKGESFEVKLKGTQVRLVSIDMEGVGTEKPIVMDMNGCHMSTKPHLHNLHFAGLLILCLGMLAMRRRRLAA